MRRLMGWLVGGVLIGWIVATILASTTGLMRFQHEPAQPQVEVPR